MSRPPVVRLLLDSGAYSALTQKQSIDLDKYIAYIEEHHDLIWRCVNLDVIPSDRHNAAVVEKAATASYKNFERMKTAGLQPIPVFHVGEDYRWLERMLADGERYIGLGGMARLKQNVRRIWLDKIFSMLTDEDGHPLVKIHGFGMTAFELLGRYPWWSVDSSTWALQAGYRRLMIPAWRDGEWDFLHPAVIGAPGTNKSSFNRHQVDLAERVHRWLKQIDVSVAELRNVPDARYRASLAFLQGVRSQLRNVRFEHRLSFGNPPIKLPKLKPLKPHPLSIFYATDTSYTNWSPLMTAVGAFDRLVSFYEMQDRPKGVLGSFANLLGDYGRLTYRAPKTPKGSPWGEHYINSKRRKLIERLAGYERLSNGKNRARTG